MGVVGSFSRVCAALFAVRWRFRRHQCRNAPMFGSLRRCNLVLNAFIASPFGLQWWQSMTRQTIYQGQCSKWRATRSTASPPTQPVVRRGRSAALSDARRWPPPVRCIGTRVAPPYSRGYRVESLISRTCGSYRENGRSISRPQPIKNGSTPSTRQRASIRMPVALSTR
jgi:hypothetical protein